MSEDDWEGFAKEILGELAWIPVDGQSIAPGTNQHQSWDDLVIKPHLLIVGGTREICARLYTAIVERRPDWHSPEIDKGRIKVVYSGDAGDKGLIAEHVREGLRNAPVPGARCVVNAQASLPPCLTRPFLLITTSRPVHPPERGPRATRSTSWRTKSPSWSNAVVCRTPTSTDQ